MNAEIKHRERLVTDAAFTVLISGFIVAGLIGFFGSPAIDGTIVLSAFVYLLAHVMRAIRLAVVTVAVLGLRFRTGLSVHFVAAPWSLVLPFKLDEAIRFGALVGLSGSPFRSATALLLDRSSDGLILLILGIAAMAAGQEISPVAIAAIFITLASVAVAFGVLPRLVETLQRYILLRHSGSGVVSVLRIIDRVRRSLDFGVRQAAVTLAFLLVSTIMIWAMEVAAVWLLLAGGDVAEAPLAGAISALFGGMVVSSVGSSELDGVRLPQFLVLLVPGVWAAIRLGFRFFSRSTGLR